LISSAFIWAFISAIMSYNYMESLSDDALTRYKNKLEVVGLSQRPYKLPADVWLNDMKQWPEVTFHDLYLYLTSFPGVPTHANVDAS